MSVPLSHYREHPDCGVLLSCGKCQLARTFDLEVVIARLTARGLDGAAVGVKSVAAYTKQPCPRCGAMSFTSGPAWDHGRAETLPRPPYGGFG